MKQLRKKYKYGWVSHEVRQDHAESMVAYVLLGCAIVTIPLAFFILALNG